MKEIIHQIVNEFYSDICEFFENGQFVNLLTAEKELSQHVNMTVCSLLEAYCQQVDEAILKDKTVRKADGLIVVRRNDRRTVLSKFGEIKYRRTYYKDRKRNCYCYPADEIMEIEKYQRVSTGLGLELSEAAQNVSYAKSSRQVTGGRVSSQTVMNKLRQSHPVDVVIEEKRNVAALHIDADEDHVTMSNGKKSIVPLVSVYEGIEKSGKRGKCKNVFHVSEYGKKPDELWEQVLTEIERRYDLEETKFYLHGDGAAWIAKGLEWLGSSEFVLDKYHKNKSIKAMTAGLGKDLRSGFDKAIRKALEEGDKASLEILRDSLCVENPERMEKINKMASYLLRNIEGIRICAIDAEANNGGCTEPHVSHILSARLSGRPMKWSADTLEKLAPILAARGPLEPLYQHKDISPLQARAVSSVRRSMRPKHHLGLPLPDAIGHIPALAIGKNTPLKCAVKIYA